MTLAEMFEQPAEEVGEWIQGMQRQAARLDLPFGPIKMIYNTRSAQELGLWAWEQGKGEAFHLAAFKAYLVEEQNLATRKVLLNLVESVGLSSAEADTILKNRTYAEKFEKDWQLAKKYSIHAIPTLVLEERKLVGAQPYDKILEFINSN